DKGAQPNGIWLYGDAELPAIHLAALQGHDEVVRVLLAAGADPLIRDSKHDGDAIGWANHFKQWKIVQMLAAHLTSSKPRAE
ncbi:MAG: hypothetical protein ACRD2A_22820, partial [Vicinamibacterales bacterium]